MNYDYSIISSQGQDSFCFVSMSFLFQAAAHAEIEKNILYILQTQESNLAIEHAVATDNRK